MRAWAAVLLVCLVATSCGGGTSSSGFERRATAVCQRYHERLARLGRPTTMRKIARIARGAARLGAQERKSLQALEPPDDAAAHYSRMIRGFARADALLPAVRRAAAGRDAARTRRLVRRGRTLVAAANVHADWLRLPDCRRA